MLHPPPRQRIQYRQHITTEGSHEVCCVLQRCSGFRTRARRLWKETVTNFSTSDTVSHTSFATKCREGPESICFIDLPIYNGSRYTPKGHHHISQAPFSAISCNSKAVWLENIVTACISWSISWWNSLAGTWSTLHGKQWTMIIIGNDTEMSLM